MPIENSVAPGTGETPALLTYMTTDDPMRRRAAFLRTYAERVRNGTAATWEIPSTVAGTLDAIAVAIEQQFAGTGETLHPPTWQPIATAPKDGTRILVVTRASGYRIARWLVDSAATPCWWAVDGGFRVEPSHWMPLPDPPVAGVVPSHASQSKSVEEKHDDDVTRVASSCSDRPTGSTAASNEVTPASRGGQGYFVCPTCGAVHGVDPNVANE